MSVSVAPLSEPTGFLSITLLSTAVGSDDGVAQQVNELATHLQVKSMCLKSAKALTFVTFIRIYWLILFNLLILKQFLLLEYDVHVLSSTFISHGVPFEWLVGGWGGSLGRMLTNKDGSAWVSVSVQIELVPDLGVLGDRGKAGTASYLSLQVSSLCVIKVPSSEVIIYT